MIPARDILAHAPVGGGPSFELLVLAAAFLFLGVVFLVQKSAKPSVAVAMILGAFVVGAGSFALGGGEEAAAIEIVSPEDGADVPDGRPLELEVGIEGVSDPARYRVLVDGEPRTTTSAGSVEVDLEPGEHTIAVELVGGDGDHDEHVADEITVTVR